MRPKYRGSNTYRNREISYLKSVKRIIKSMKQKYCLIAFMDDATELILSRCKCLQSIIPVTNIGSEKKHKVREACHKVNEAKKK